MEQAFNLSPEQLCERIATADALIIRSATQASTIALGAPNGSPASQGKPVGTAVARAAVSASWLCMMKGWLSPGICQVTKEVFQAAKGRLKVVGRAGVGVDNVDLASATDTPPAYHARMLLTSLPKKCDVFLAFLGA